jgi:hypothetical protein
VLTFCTPDQSGAQDRPTDHDCRARGPPQSGATCDPASVMLNRRELRAIRIANLACRKDIAPVADGGTGYSSTTGATRQAWPRSKTRTFPTSSQPEDFDRHSADVDGAQLAGG